MTSEFSLIIVDEIQKVMPLLDAVQDLIDSQVAQFILTVSSARKLRREGDANLLPGRVVVLRMDPLVVSEMTHYLQRLKNYFSMVLYLKLFWKNWMKIERKICFHMLQLI